jgi:hypothetical protein
LSLRPRTPLTPRIARLIEDDAMPRRPHFLSESLRQQLGRKGFHGVGHRYGDSAAGCRIGRAASARNGFHPRGDDVDKDRCQQHCGYENGERPAQGIFLVHF